MVESSETFAAFSDPPPFSVEAQGLALTFYPGGSDRLEALLRLIDEARERLRLCFYIFSTDQCAVRVRDALTAAARPPGCRAGPGTSAASCAKASGWT